MFTCHNSEREKRWTASSWAPVRPKAGVAAAQESLGDNHQQARRTDLLASMRQPRIRTPLGIRWQRFRYSLLPAVTFAASVAVVGVLWKHQGSMPNAIGRVEAVRVNVTAGTDGKLMPMYELPHGRWQLFDHVQQGQIVARLDDSPLRALLTALRGDAAALEAELEATRVEAGLDHVDRQQEHLRGITELACQVERYRLDIVDRQALIEEDRLELQRLDAQLNVMKRARPSGMLTQTELVNAQAERNMIARLLEAHVATLRQAEANYNAAVSRQNSYPSLEAPDVARLLAPIRASIGAAEGRVEEVRAQIDALEIRSPIAGRVCAVYYHPGQGVRAGEWILTIAAEKAECIIAYVRPEQRLRPVLGDLVGVRVRLVGSRMVDSYIEAVGSQWEPMPLELLRDQNVPELALPVRIGIPEGLEVRPGELVDVRFGGQASTDDRPAASDLGEGSPEGPETTAPPFQRNGIGYPPFRHAPEPARPDQNPDSNRWATCYANP